MVKRCNRSWIANYRESYSYILNAPLTAPSTPVLPVGNSGGNQQVLRGRVSGAGRCLPKALAAITITFTEPKDHNNWNLSVSIAIIITYILETAHCDRDRPMTLQWKKKYFNQNSNLGIECAVISYYFKFVRQFNAQLHQFDMNTLWFTLYH